MSIGLLMIAWTGLAMPQAGAACDITVEQPGRTVAAAYRLIATERGAACADAKLTLTVRSPRGRTVYRIARDRRDIPWLFDVKDRRGFANSLREWARPAGLTTATQPAWLDGGAPFKYTGAPYAIDPLVARAQYEALRRAAAPMLCLPQGSESSICIALRGERDAVAIGMQIVDT